MGKEHAKLSRIAIESLSPEKWAFFELLTFILTCIGSSWAKFSNRVAINRHPDMGTITREFPGGPQRIFR
jgi:hypothetical protein